MFRRGVSVRVGCVMLLGGLGSVVACTLEGEAGEEAVSSESDLRQLAPSEVVGSIAYGETKTVSYTSEPRYRALSFQAKAGDTIEARFVGKKNLDTIGYLLSSTFATLKQNDDESETSLASRFTHKISKAGTYYLAVREANEEDGEIAISLSLAGSATPDAGTPPPDASAPPMNGGTGRIVKGRDRTISRSYIYSDGVLIGRTDLPIGSAEWDLRLWDGYISMKMSAVEGKGLTGPAKPNGSCDYYPPVLEDGAGRRYALKSVPLAFSRLPLPIRLIASQKEGCVTVNVADVKYEVTATRVIPKASYRGKFMEDASGAVVARIGSGLDYLGNGTGLKFHVETRFFNNFTNGNACAGQVRFRSLFAGGEEFFGLSNPSGDVSLPASLSLYVLPACISSRLASPEDPNADYQIDVSDIEVGDPI